MTFFPINLHPLERMARLFLGLVMMVVGWYAEASAPAFALRLFAFYPILTGLAGWCPVYALVRIFSRR